MSSTLHPRFNSISFQCDHRTRVGCDEQTWQEAHTGLPAGWVNRDGGHLGPEHANAELQNATRTASAAHRSGPRGSRTPRPPCSDP